MRCFVALLSATAVDAVRVVKQPPVATVTELVVDGMSFESLDLQVESQRPQDGDPVWEAIKAFDAENQCQDIRNIRMRSYWEYWYKTSDRTCMSAFRYMGSLTLTKLRNADIYNESNPCWRAADLAEMEQRVSSCIKEAPKQPTLSENECKEIKAKATSVAARPASADEVEAVAEAECGRKNGAKCRRKVFRRYANEGCRGPQPFSPKWCSCRKSSALLSQYAFRDVMECGGAPDQILALLGELETCKEELPKQGYCQGQLNRAHVSGLFEKLESFQQEPKDADTCSEALRALGRWNHLTSCSKEFVAEKLMTQAYVRKCAPIGFMNKRAQKNTTFFSRPFDAKEDYCNRYSVCKDHWTKTACEKAARALTCAYEVAFSCHGSPEQVPEMEAKVAAACTKLDD